MACTHGAGCINPIHELARRLGLSLVPTDYEVKEGSRLSSVPMQMCPQAGTHGGQVGLRHAVLLYGWLQDKVTYVPPSLAIPNMAVRSSPRDAARNASSSSRTDASLAHPGSSGSGHANCQRVVSDLSLALCRQLTAGSITAATSTLMRGPGMCSEVAVTSPLCGRTCGGGHTYGGGGSRFQALPADEVAASGQLYLQLEQYMRWLSSSDPSLRLVG